MIYFCCDERRRALVRDHGVVNGVDYNGIDFLEVLDNDAPLAGDRQRFLFVHFLKPLAPAQLRAHNVIIQGGERIRGIAVVTAAIGAGDQAKVLTVEVNQPGDYSIYTLRLVQGAHRGTGSDEPPPGFDPVLSAVPFSFKIECPSDFDCRTDQTCSAEAATEPEIDYLAKDFNSFRQLMLDRMSVLMPQWRERNAADLGVALVELLAYVGDHLSYQQDAIATEAYLNTARRRVSVRRHALLIDYFMHDGCNARAWMQVRTDSDGVELIKGTRLLTRVAGLQQEVVNPETDKDAMRQITAAAPQVFETMADITLYAAHNEIEFYPWSDERCCLAAGSTRATLKGELPNLQERDVLVFEEVVGPLTGVAADADPSHRHAVRLTTVEASVDKLVIDRDTNKEQQLTEIEWHTDDALPFALCISTRTKNSQLKDNVSVAYGNIVLADHGQTLKLEEIGTVPTADDSLATIASSAGDRCADHAPRAVLPAFRPRLKEQPLTQAARLKPLQDGSSLPFARNPDASAAGAFRWEVKDVLPEISLDDSNGGFWEAQHDLLSSNAFKEEFVAEVDDDGRATLRFGDDQYGLQPAPDVEFRATYRIGNGASGNIGPESLAHVLTTDNRIVGVHQPLPASGGIDPESIEHVRRIAPSAFRIQERAVTPDDYAAVAERHREVQQAAATVRWTGSWRTVFLTLDRVNGRPVDAEFEHDMRLHLERFRMASHDIEIDGPQFVPLEIEITVCVQPNYFRGDVRAALLEVFSNRILPDGQRGFFHPDKFTFAQPVYLSALYAAAQEVEGVRFVTIEKFQRLGSPSRVALDEGVLTIGRLEIARLDNDPNFAERGVFRLTLEGGE